MDSLQLGQVDDVGKLLSLQAGVQRCHSDIVEATGNVCDQPFRTVRCHDTHYFKCSVTILYYVVQISLFNSMRNIHSLFFHLSVCHPLIFSKLLSHLFLLSSWVELHFALQFLSRSKTLIVGELFHGSEHVFLQSRLLWGFYWLF